MFYKKNNLKTLIVQFFIFTAIFFTSISGVVYARSSGEIGQEISDQQKLLEQSKKDLENSKKNLDYYNSALGGATGGVPQIEAEIKQIEAELEYNQKRLDVLNQAKLIKELEKDKRIVERQESLKTSYMDWRARSNDFAKILNTNENYDLKKNQQYSSIVIDNQQENIMGLTSELVLIAGDLDSYNTLKFDLENKTADLNKKKEDLQAQILAFQSAINSTSNKIGGLQVSVNSIQNNITALSEQQRQAILREEEILRQNNGTLGNSDCQPEAGYGSGSIFFCGNGRDLAMGHGVGMSQYGAKAAADQGWSAAQILQFYYTGTQVVSNGLSAEITVKYCQDNPALDAYQDGPGGNTCNDGRAPVTERVSFDTYLAGLGEMPEGWHIEARKAQMIAARTYAARYTSNGNPGIPICLTTYCQVSYFKNGDTSELSVAQATSGLVILYGGQLIEALYSADNNQGNGTADSDTRFQNFDGSGTATPYLRSVNDNQFAASARLYWNYYCQSSPCGLWKWKTRNYSWNDMNVFLNASGLNYMMVEIGGVASISFERDPSLRVKKVWFNGNNGQKRVMGGWWFKYYWNIWADSKGTYDYIYSQTYYLNVNP